MLGTRALLVAIVVVLFALPAAAQTRSRQQYGLRAALDPETHQVAGEVDIEFENTSRTTLDSIVLHLYLNAFQDDQSVFMQESGGQLRGERFVGSGRIELHTLKIDDVDVLSSADDELVSGDHTQMRVATPHPIEPGTTHRVRAEFTSHLPPVFARSGYHGDFHMVAQWFPKLAKLEPDGHWESFPYHGNGEFYADFADYDVTIVVPDEWEVGASGICRGLRTSELGVEHRYVARQVHDFAFATAPWFQDRRVRRDHGPQLRVLYPPGYESAVERHIEVTEVGLSRYGRVLGEYPYETLTIIVPPRGADGAAGMEYPTLFVTAGPWWRFGGAPMALHDEVTAHELGHQWFQGMVASNEVAWPMLDEGLTEWITSDLLQEMHGDAGGLGAPLPRLSNFEVHRFSAMRGTLSTPPGLRAHEFSRSEYGRSVYSRSAVVLETVARTWGRARFRRALGAYARQHRFSHPTPNEFFAAMDREYGPWMSERILRPALMDGAFAARIASLENGRARAERFGGLPLPARVRVRTRADEVLYLPWLGSTRTFELDRDDIVDIRVDPEEHGLLDVSRADDRQTSNPATGDIGPLLYVFQTLLGWVSA